MKKYIMMLAAVALLFSCNEKEEHTASSDSVSTSADTLTFGPEGGSQSLTVTSSGDWRLSGLSDWVKASASEGKSGAVISFTAEANESDDIKEAEFKFFTGAAVKKVVVKTTPGYVVDLESDSEVSVSSDATDVNVKLHTNISDLKTEFSDGGADWISLESRTDVFGMTLLKFKVKRSQVFKSRESVLKISGSGQEVSVKLVQAQRDTIVFTENRVVLDLAERDVTVKFKTNITPEFEIASWMEKTDETSGAVGADGLTEKTVKLHLSKSVASRLYTLIFKMNNTEYGKYAIKQQNPNPILCNISDAVLRAKLNELGWILGDDTTTECEVLELGLTGTSLSLAGAGYYSYFTAEKIDGLGAFPALETLSITRASSLSTIDVTDSKSLKTIKMQQVYKVEEIKTGSSPVEEVNFGTYSSDYISTSKVTISGENIKTVYANNSSWYISYGYDEIEELDVTGCPALTTLNAKRAYESWGDSVVSLKRICITEAQKSAMDAGTLVVEKADGTDFVVK